MKPVPPVTNRPMDAVRHVSSGRTAARTDIASWTGFEGVLIPSAEQMMRTYAIRFAVPGYALDQAMSEVSRRQPPVTSIAGATSAAVAAWAAAVEQELEQAYGVVCDLSGFREAWIELHRPNQAWLHNVPPFQEDTTLPTLNQAELTTPTLAFDRTISRGLVHRVGLEEVFLTDFKSLSEDRFLAAARLPRTHLYYNDHLNQPKTHDPLVVFESVRQSLLCATHMHHDVPADTKAITAQCRLEITDPDALRFQDGVYDLELAGSVVTAKSRQDVLSRVVHQVEVFLGGRQVAIVTVDTALRSPDAYQALRMKERRTPPPQSDELFAREMVSTLPSALVGRSRSDNVLLLDPLFAGRSLVARMRIPVSHTSMFDHRQDHLPGPVMVEAARQAGLLLVGEVFGRSPAKTLLAELDVDYERFAELDEEITVHASFEPELGTPQAPGSESASVYRSRGYERPILIDFRQSDCVLAAMKIRLVATESRNTVTPVVDHAI